MQSIRLFPSDNIYFDVLVNDVQVKKKKKKRQAKACCLLASMMQAKRVNSYPHTKAQYQYERKKAQ